MAMPQHQHRLFNWTQRSGWVLWAVLALVQCVSALRYDFGVALGLQQPASAISPVGAAWWHGFAVADSLVFVPLMAIGLVGHRRGTALGRIALAAAAGISVYWPAVFGASMVLSRRVDGWKMPSETAIWAFGGVFFAWGLMALYCLWLEDRRARTAHR